jgi:hypothetical protein
MKRKMFLFQTVLLLLYHAATAQVIQRTFVDHDFTRCTMTANYEFAFSANGKISIYNRDIGRGSYFFSSPDDGNSWKQKTTLPLVVQTPLRYHNWGYGRMEYDAKNNLQLVMKYVPCYSNAWMHYQLFLSKDDGAAWEGTSAITDGSAIKWEGSGKKPVDDQENLWCSQKITAEKTVMVSIASISSHFVKPGKLYFSTTDDHGKNWKKQAVVVKGQEVNVAFITGMRFFSEQLGLLFLEDSYLLTTDAGTSWEEYRYPYNAKVHSADASDPQHIYISKGNDIGMFSVKSPALENIYISNTEQVLKLQLRDNILHCLTSGGYYMKFSTGKIQEDEPANVNISVFPNPVSNMVTFSAPGLSGKTVSIISTEGKTVAQKQGNGISVSFDVQHLPAGIYFTEVRTPGEKPVSVKWIKK